MAKQKHLPQTQLCVYTHLYTHAGALGVHASAYSCRSLWSECRAVLFLGTGQLWVASMFPHIIL